MCYESKPDLTTLIADNTTHYRTFSATVTAVDNTDYTCTVQPLHEAPPLYNVRLSADRSGKGIIKVPAVNSTVLVTQINNTRNNAFVSACSATDEIILNCDGTVKIDATSVIFNGGNNGELVNLSDLVTELNALIHRLNNHQHDYTDNGAVKTTTAEAGETPLPSLTAVQLADPTIRH